MPELLEDGDLCKPELTGLLRSDGAGVEVAVASMSCDCDAPHDGQNFEVDSISRPHDKQLMEESFATSNCSKRRHHISDAMSRRMFFPPLWDEQTPDITTARFGMRLVLTFMRLNVLLPNHEIHQQRRA
jgi:hypothetical protein